MTEPKRISDRQMRRILILLTAIALTIGGTVAAAPANAATCTTVYLTNPTIGQVLPAGTRRCVNITDSPFIRIYRRDNPELRQIDWADRWAHTTYPPNTGRYQPTADRIRSLARKYDMRVMFANRDLAGRLGCSSASGFTNTVSGASMPSPRHPGEGLIVIGTGFTSRCMRDTRSAVNVFKHEAAHVEIERICGTMGPPRVGDRGEEVTSAYAMKFFGATMNDGGLRPTRSDFWRATKLHGGWCG